MHHYKIKYRHFFILILFLFVLSCNNGGSPAKIKGKVIVKDPRSMDERVGEIIHSAVSFAEENSGKIDDSSKIDQVRLVSGFYDQEDQRPVWSTKGKWQPLADSLYQFIAGGEKEGLFPNDYHFQGLQAIRNKFDTDSTSRMDAAQWGKADLFLTDGFMHLIKDLKLGRLQPDSVSLNKDSISGDEFFINTLNDFLEKKQLTELFVSLQPKHKGYWELKKGIGPFVDSMDRKEYTHVSFPFIRKNAKDSLQFIKVLQKRLFEGDCIPFSEELPDSAQLFRAIKKYQLQKGLTADGKYGKDLVNSLNSNDEEKYKRVVITLDKYKQLPDTMPDIYIWVNLPGYYLNLMEKDSVVFESRVICGKPETRTPLLNGKISDMVIYPTWTVPTSIIVKQYLPKLKNDPNYLSTLGLKLIDNKGDSVDPNTVQWSKYSKGIPYKLMQESGDDNSLGVIKFNFSNPYAVYLHDTNQRYLFKKGSRAISHGCVRVQEWQKLAFFIAHNDSTLSVKNDPSNYNADSIKNWVAKKERHRIDVKNKIPLFIRYFSCEGRNGRIQFFEDVYGEDKMLMQRYFAKK